MKRNLPIIIIAATSASPILVKRDSVYGFDISHYQSSVDFDAAYNDGGLRFVYIKATESTDYIDPAFSDHYIGATNAGFIRGGYHFAHGDVSASDQADYFVENGGNVRQLMNETRPKVQDRFEAFADPFVLLF